MNEDKTKIYLGNFYGQKDSYDGAVFSCRGIAPTIRARTGGQVYIIVEFNTETLEKESL